MSSGVAVDKHREQKLVLLLYLQFKTSSYPAIHNSSKQVHLLLKIRNGKSLCLISHCE